MGIVLPLLFGIVISALGIALPGLINMTAAKISVRDGRDRAIVFSLGATVIVFVQTYIAVSFAKFINRRPDIIYLLEEIGLGIFTLLTIYFLFIAKKPEPKDEEDVVDLRSHTGNFFLGALLSGLNFFPIPYYVFVSITLSSYGYFSFDNLYVFLFVMGVVLGSFGIFYLYVIFFKKIEHKTDFFMKNINYFIGSVTGLVAIVTFIKIMRNL